MISGFKWHFERAMLAMFGLLFLGSVAWSVWSHREVKRIRANPVAMHLAKSGYRTMEWASSTPSFEGWKSPAPQSAGAGWRFELFTPPTVFFNQSTGQFVVTPTEEKKTAPAFALELVSVRRELYRLQLNGYFGEVGNYRAAFSQPGKAGVLFASEGTHFDRLSLTLRKFFFRGALSVGGTPGIAEKIALAELQDDHTGEIVTLSNHEPKYADAPVAVVKINTANGTLREVRAGDVISVEKLVYRIGRVALVPAELVVTCEEPGTSRIEIRTLHPIASDTPAVALQSAESTASFPRLATGFATSKQ